MPSAGVLKVQKLLYYCKAWSLVWHGDALFAERLEAWDQGPVVADVWHDEHRGRKLPMEQELGAQQLAVVDYVIKRYGCLTGDELKDLTHREGPWLDLTDDGQLTTHNPEITDTALRRWFCQDAEYLAFRTEAARLLRRRDIYGFEGDPIPSFVRSATERVLRERSTGQTA